MIHPWIIEQIKREEEEKKRQREQNERRIHLPISQYEEEEYKRKGPKEESVIVINF